MNTDTQEKSTTAPKHAIVWFEIPVSNLVKARKFYETVLNTSLDIEVMGPNETAVFHIADPQSGVGGHLYEGKPAQDGNGPTLHLPVPDGLEVAMKRLEENGGQLVSPIIEIPAGRFVYCKDPDGNSIGLFG